MRPVWFRKFSRIVICFRNKTIAIPELGAPPSRPEVTIFPRELEVREGEPVDFRCTARGSPNPVLRWTSAQGAALNPQHTFVDGVFHIPRATKADEGHYMCVATNPSGEDTQMAALMVRGKKVAICRIERRDFS